MKLLASGEEVMFSQVRGPTDQDYHRLICIGLCGLPGWWALRKTLLPGQVGYVPQFNVFLKVYHPGDAGN